MPKPLQAKLLRALEAGEVRRIGENETRRVDVRFVAATNVDIKAAIDSGRLPQRSVLPPERAPHPLPPLRERGGDSPLLVEHFLAALRSDGAVTGCTGSALDALLAYDYPGNVRQLEHIVQRAVAVARGPLIDLDDLPEEVLARRSAPAPRRRHASPRPASAPSAR